MTTKTELLEQISDLLDQVENRVRQLDLDRPSERECLDGIYHYYTLVERLTERKTMVDFVEEWGFNRDTTYFADVYRRNAPQGHYEIWRKANPNRIYIYNSNGEMVDTFDIDWALHIK